MKVKLPLDAPGVDKDDADTWPEVYVCDTQDHELRCATHRAHTVQGPHDCCPHCAVALTRIYEALGAHLHVEELQLGAIVKRLTGGGGAP